MSGRIQSTTYRNSNQEYFRIVKEERKAQARLLRKHRKDADKKPVVGYVMIGVLISCLVIISWAMAQAISG